MNTTDQVPEYLVIINGDGTQNGFFAAPDLHPPGTIIRTWAPPNQGLKPLNEAARQVMEEWYTEEHPAADKFTGRPMQAPDGTPIMWQPHKMYRPADIVAAQARSEVEVLAHPEKDSAPILSLADLQKGPKATDQRPPPVHVRPGKRGPQVATPNVAAAPGDPSDPSQPISQVVAAASPTPPSARAGRQA